MAAGAFVIGVAYTSVLRTLWSRVAPGRHGGAGSVLAGHHLAAAFATL